MYRILVCDDDKEIVRAIELYLAEEGYRILRAYDGAEAVKTVKECAVHLLIVDIMMPKMDGIQAIKEIRKFSGIPIICLTARTEDEDKIEGLNVGADDYMEKPFNPMELIARVKSQLRRYTKLGSINPVNQEQLFTTGELVVNDETKEVSLEGKRLKFTPIEYNILLFLLKNKGKVFSIEEIYRNIWNEEAIGADNTVAVHIRHIREKIEVNPKDPRYLKVVWGVGYKIENI